MLLNISENYNMQAINEVYFGKTPEILAIEKQLDIFRNKYMDTGIFINPTVNSDSDLLKFNRMVEKYFGFGCFCLHIIKESIPNAFTIPIDNRYDIVNTNKNLIVDKNTFKFKKESDYSCIVCVYSGLIFDSTFTTSEVMACIMHEIGHNFYAALDKKHGFMINFYKSILAINNLLYAINNLDDLKSLAYVAADFAMRNNIITNITLKMEKNMRENNSIWIYIGDIITSIISIFKTVKMSIADLMSKLTLGILAIPNAVLYSISKINPFSLAILPIGYQNERLADNFAAIYGYGAELASFVNKTTSNNLQTEKDLFNKIPIISHIYSINMATAGLIVSAFDEHPIEIARAADQLALLERELQKEDLDPKMRKVISSDVKAIKKELNNFTDLSGGITNKDFVRNAYFRALYKTTNSKDLKDLLLDDINKFNIYDNTYKEKSRKGAY